MITVRNAAPTLRDGVKILLAAPVSAFRAPRSGVKAGGNCTLSIEKV